MTRYVLDSDAVIDYLNGTRDSMALIRSLYWRRDELCLCDIVVTETYAGLRPPHRARAEALLMTCTFLLPSAASARQAGDWCYAYARQGIIIAANDALIAATAFDHDAVIITRNVRHYPMPEVGVLPLPPPRR